MLSFAEQVHRRRVHMALFTKPKRLRRRVAPRHFPKAIELAYTARLLEVLRFVRRLVEAKLHVAQRQLAEHRALMKLDAGDNWNDAMAEIRISVDQSFGTEVLANLARPFAERTSEAQKMALQAQVKQAVGIDIPFADPKLGARLNAWTSENVGLIKSIEAKYLDDVQTVVTRSISDGDRWEELADKLAERFDVSASRAALIACDQVGKFYSAVSKARQEDLGITEYIWSTSLDERVRPEHAEREGEVFKWSDPPEDGHPGEPVRCRCTSTPVFDQLLDSLVELDS